MLLNAGIGEKMIGKISKSSSFKNLVEYLDKRMQFSSERICMVREQRING